MKSEELKKLCKKWTNCKKCELHRNRKNIVHYRGNVDAKIVAIGEAPGADEDEQGIPFVGRSGVALNSLFKQARIKSSDILITNTVACRPLGNRTPNINEMSTCKERLVDLLNIVRPNVLLLLGGVAAKSIAGISSITGWRGKVIEVDVFCKQMDMCLTFNAVATFHPSYLIRNGSSISIQRKMIGDIILAKRVASVR